MFGRRRRLLRGHRCKTWQRVTGPGGRRFLRCKKFAHPAPHGLPPGAPPANKGAHCIRFKKVFGPWFNKRVLRCARYSGRRAKMPSIRFVKLPPAAPMRRLPPPPKRIVDAAYVPLSLPSMEIQVEGRTPYKQRWF